MKLFWRSLSGIVIFIIVWQALSLLINKPIIIPEPVNVFRTLGDVLIKPAILYDAFQTAWKVLLALALVLVVGIPIGLLLGIFKPLQDMSRPIIMVIQAVPVISWLSLVIFTWGISWQGPVCIAFLSLLPISVLTTISGVQNLDKKLLEVARLYNVPRVRVLKDIYLGSLLPFIIAIIDVSLGQSWKAILVAEYLSGDKGLGVQIAWARQYLDVPRVYALTLLAVLLGIITEKILRYYLKRVYKKWAPM